MVGDIIADSRATSLGIRMLAGSSVATALKTMLSTILRSWVLTVADHKRTMFSQRIRLIEDAFRLPRDVGPVGQPEPVESHLRVGHLIGERVDVYSILYRLTTRFRIR